MQTIGYILITIGVLFIIVGLVGIFRFHNFYARILSAADIDTVGLITVLVGVAFISGFNLFTLKVLLIIAIMCIINPIVTSSIASSAFFSGYKIQQEEDEKGND